MLRTSSLLRLYNRTENTFTCVLFDLSLNPVAFFSIDKDFTNQLCRITASCFSDRVLLAGEFQRFCNNVPNMRTSDWYLLKHDNFIRFVEYSNSFAKTIDTERAHLNLFKPNLD